MTAAIIGNYLHHDQTIGAMVIVECETDFATKTPQVQQLANDLALHLAGTTDNETLLAMQRFVKDESITLAEMVSNVSKEVGEKVTVRDWSVVNCRPQPEEES